MGAGGLKDHVMQTKTKKCLIKTIMYTIIILIVGAIIIPQYSDYVGVSIADEGITITSKIRDDFDTFYQDNGRFPTEVEYPANQKVAQLLGKYIGKNGVSVDYDNSVISVNFNAGELKGQRLDLSPVIQKDKTIFWQCSGTVTPKDIPPRCQ